MTAIRNNEAYVYSVELYPLRAWLKSHLVDVSSIKTERQALFFATKLANEDRPPKDRLRFDFPKPHEPVFPALLKAQRLICGDRKSRKVTA